MNEETQVDRLTRRIKDNRLLSYAIVAGGIFLALVSFAKGLQEAGGILGKAFSSVQLVAQYDAATKEVLIATARDVDAFFLNIEASETKVVLKDVKSDYLRIKVNLRSILLRNEVRPLNEGSIKQSQLLLQQWDEVGKLLQTPLGKEAAATAREIMFMSFKAVVIREEGKKPSR